MTPTTSRPTIDLVAGHWLGAWAWDDVLEHVDADHTRAVAMTVPGLYVGGTYGAATTLDDQATAIRDAIVQHRDQPAVLVAHSGTNAPSASALTGTPSSSPGWCRSTPPPQRTAERSPPTSPPNSTHFRYRRSTLSVSRRAWKA
jgi:hypothetical protein